MIMVDGFPGSLDTILQIRSKIKWYIAFPKHKKALLIS